MNNHNVLKKLLALALSLAMVLSVAPITAFAEEGSNIPLGTSQQPMSGQIGTFAHEPENTPLGELGGLLYTSLGGDNAKVSGYDPVALPADVVIPATVTFGGDTYNVTSIGDYAFDSCYSLTSVVIPNSVTTIGDAAFYYCTGLTSVTIPDSVESIGDYAFVGCSGLTSITIPNSVTTIGDYAFVSCTSLESVTIGNSVTAIGKGAFAYCTSLTSVTIPDSVETIGNSAFADCNSLTSITIPNSVTSIGDNAFYGCTSVQSFTVAAGNAHYSAENGVLYNKDKSTLIAYPIAKVGTSFTIGNSVETIGSLAFARCTSLTSITIGNSVGTIGAWAFAECTSLQSFTVAAGNAHYSAENGVLYNKDKSTLITYPIAKVDTVFTIPNSVKIIYIEAFNGHTSLTSVTIPNSVTSIGRSAFGECYSLTSVTFLSATPPSIGTDVFSGCAALTTINVPLGSEAAYKAAFPEHNSMIVPVDGNTGGNTGGSSSSGGGSNKPDTRAVVGGTTTSKPLTKTEATKLFEAALAAKPAGATTLSFKVQNSPSVSQEVLAELAALAKKNGVALTVHFDRVIGGRVMSRLSINPATTTTDLNLTITENKALAARFAKYYSNPLAVYTVPAAGSVAIKLPENLKPDGLVLYSYDPATNTYAQLTGAKPWVDTNGYIHFDVAAGTDVVISQRELLKK